MSALPPVGSGDTATPDGVLADNAGVQPTSPSDVIRLEEKVISGQSVQEPGQAAFDSTTPELAGLAVNTEVELTTAKEVHNKDANYLYLIDFELGRIRGELNKLSVQVGVTAASEADRQAQILRLQNSIGEYEQRRRGIVNAEQESRTKLNILMARYLLAEHETEVGVGNVVDARDIIREVGSEIISQARLLLRKELALLIKNVDLELKQDASLAGYRRNLVRLVNEDRTLELLGDFAADPSAGVLSRTVTLTPNIFEWLREGSIQVADPSSRDDIYDILGQAQRRPEPVMQDGVQIGRGKRYVVPVSARVTGYDD